jgi:hypothetical protein
VNSAGANEPDARFCNADSIASEQLFTQTGETLAYARISLRNSGINRGDDSDSYRPDISRKRGRAVDDVSSNNDVLATKSFHLTKVITKRVPPVG